MSESPKESSEPTGSPAPVIQHSSVTASPNGLNVRSAAEAVATSVLTQMASQRTELSMPIQSHVIMSPQSQSAGRWCPKLCDIELTNQNLQPERLIITKPLSQYGVDTVFCFSLGGGLVFLFLLRWVKGSRGASQTLYPIQLLAQSSCRHMTLCF